VNDSIRLGPIAREHIAGVMRLCEAEGWPSFLESADKTWRALTAPGVITIVATQGDDVVGFAQIQSDGLIQAHLSNMAVDARLRRQSIGRRLVEEAFERCGAKRIDLNSTEGADAFYESFAHQKYPGYRIYPDGGKRARG
jgi:ribosomal protein S18 acetylase RimI-like enzyme